MQRQATILFLGKDTSPLDLVHAAVSGADVLVSTATDWLAALHSASTKPPTVLLIGPDIPVADMRSFTEQAKSNPALKNIPSVLLVSEASRDVILEFITLGVRSYIVIPCRTTALRTRLAFHIPALSGNASARPQPPAKSVGERLRQRMERKSIQDLQNSLQTPAETMPFPSILVVEQIFSENFGLTIRENERHVSLYEKIDDLKLRLGGDNSHLVGVVIQLLSVGKVRIGFREKTERLCLSDPDMIMSRDRAITLVDSYLAATERNDPEPNPLTCRLIVR
jgi:CheY-like chemotaxis protein